VDTLQRPRRFIKRRSVVDSCSLGMVASLPYTLTSDEMPEFMYHHSGDWELTNIVIHPDDSGFPKPIQMTVLGPKNNGLR
jgi:hypothetical protein